MRVDLLPGDEPIATEFETLPLVKRISRSYVQSYMEVKKLKKNLNAN